MNQLKSAVQNNNPAVKTCFNKDSDSQLASWEVTKIFKLTNKDLLSLNNLTFVFGRFKLKDVKFTTFSFKNET